MDEELATATREAAMGSLDARVHALECMVRDGQVERWRVSLAAHGRHVPAMVLLGEAKARCAACRNVRGHADGSCPRCGSEACPVCWTCRCTSAGPDWSVQHLPPDSLDGWLAVLRGHETRHGLVPWPWSRVAVVVATMGAAMKGLEAQAAMASLAMGDDHVTAHAQLRASRHALAAAQGWIDERQEWRREFHAATLPMGKEVRTFACGPAMAIIGADPTAAIHDAAVAALSLALAELGSRDEPRWSILRAMQEALVRWALPGAP